MDATSDSVAQILGEVSGRFRGPGGVVAVLKEGKVIGRQVWGYADMEQRIPMTTSTILPICSISKQMVAGLLTDLHLHPTPLMADRGEAPSKQFADELGRLLRPELLQNTGLTIERLCHMQSGVRDYWALTVLWGAKPEGVFSIDHHGPQMLDRLRSLHFESGTQYSYANTNFYIIGRLIERVTQQSLGQLLNERIFVPAGMATARLCADTSQHPPPCVGYEGIETSGYYQAVNNINWAGDAGIVASLEDMISYEKFIDSSRKQPRSWYQINAAPTTYEDGTSASYGNGLDHYHAAGVPVVGHSGALRGYRLNRFYAPESRMSIITLNNYESNNPDGIATYVMRRILNVPQPKRQEIDPMPEWFGVYLETESYLATFVTRGAKGKVVISYTGEPQVLHLTDAHRAESSDVVATLEGDVITFDMKSDHRNFQARRVPKQGDKPHVDIQGDYHCDEIDSTFHCAGEGSLLFGFFDGFLGEGPAHLMRCIGKDTWALACSRSMDATPPGDWTIVVRRDQDGAVTGVIIGCWLARNLVFQRKDKR